MIHSSFLLSDDEDARKQIDDVLDVLDVEDVLRGAIKHTMAKRPDERGTFALLSLKTLDEQMKAWTQQTLLEHMQSGSALTLAEHEVELKEEVELKKVGRFEKTVLRSATVCSLFPSSLPLSPCGTGLSLFGLEEEFGETMF